MEISAPITIADIPFGNRLMNGAYVHSKTMEDIKKLANSASGAVVVGSITAKARVSNPRGGYWINKEHFYSLNSFGMPNGGISYFRKRLPDMVAIAHARHKPLIANVAGFTPDEFGDLVQLAQVAGVDMVELNLGCPNVWDDGQQKRIFSFHASLVKATLDHIGKQRLTVKLGVKISPLPPDILAEVADVISKSKIVHVVTATNSYPNAALTADAAQAPNDILAGLAGKALKPISVGVVKQLHALLPKHIAIIGCGGINTAGDVEDYVSAGAQAVQLASSLMDNGLATFADILS